MTRKDYVLIAAALADARRDILDKEPPASHANLLDSINYAAEHIAGKLAYDNARFDRARFFKACIA